MTDIEQTNMQNEDINVNDVPDDNIEVPSKKANKKKRKVENDEDGNPIKKLRMTNKTRYPNVKGVQPRTAYQYFIMEKSKDNNDKIVNDPTIPKLKTKDMSDQWRVIDDRTKWNDLAIADKQRFYEEVRDCGYEINEKKKKATRPCSAFLLYARSNQKEYRATHDVTYPDALKALGAQWKDPEFKDATTPFLEEAAVLKEQWKLDHAQLIDTNQ